MPVGISWTLPLWIIGHKQGLQSTAWSKNSKLYFTYYFRYQKMLAVTSDETT